MDTLSEEIKYWLSTTFQNTIEHSLQLSALPGPEETPHTYRYEAIKNLKDLLNVEHPYHFITYITLG